MKLFLASIKPGSSPLRNGFAQGLPVLATIREALDFPVLVNVDFAAVAVESGTRAADGAQAKRNLF